MKQTLKTCNFELTELCSVEELSCSSSLKVCEKKGTVYNYALIGIIIGAAVLIGLIIIALCCCGRKRKDTKTKEVTKASSISKQKLNSSGSISSKSSSSSSSSSSSKSSSANNDDKEDLKSMETLEVGGEESRTNPSNSSFEPLPDISRDGGKLGDDIFVKKEKSFVLLDIPEGVKNDFVEDLIDTNPALLSPFLALKDDASHTSRSSVSSKSSRSSVSSKSSKSSVSSKSSCSSCSSSSKSSVKA